MEEKRAVLRREQDGHNSPCPLLQEHMMISAEIHADLQEIKATLKATAEMLQAFNTAKGFVTGLQVIGYVVKWATLIGGAITVVYLWMKR